MADGDDDDDDDDDEEEEDEGEEEEEEDGASPSGVLYARLEAFTASGAYLLLKLDAKRSALLDAYLDAEAEGALLSGTLLLECTRGAHVDVARLEVLIEKRLVAKLFDELLPRLLDELEAELLACVRQLTASGGTGRSAAAGAPAAA